MQIPLARPSVGARESELVLEALHSGQLAHGPFNRQFEDTFANVIRVANAVSLNSCASALELALKATGITGEVIVPSFTFAATANAVVAAGATPVFCDVDRATRNVTSVALMQMINSRTEAVIAVHFAGLPCDLEDVGGLCARRGLLLIEDSAQTLGATWKGKQAGSCGIGCFSFYPSKNITTGEGGMLTTSDNEIAERVREISAHGISRANKQRVWHREASVAGHNYRMSNIQAAMGVAQLGRLPELNSRRRFLADTYTELIRALTHNVETPVVPMDATHSFQMYCVAVPPAKRAETVARLNAHGIGASVHYDPPVHRQRAFAQYALAQDLSTTEGLAASLVTLPIYPSMAVDDVERVVSELDAALRHNGVGGGSS